MGRAPRIVLAAALVATTSAAAARPPDFHAVDYKALARHLRLLPTMGSAAVIRKTARGLRGATAVETLRNIGGWIERNLRLDPKVAYSWRRVDRIVADGVYGGCADHALLFGALARAAGIPTVWVKTMDESWIREFRRAPKGRSAGTWRGHVFLEVHLGGRWVLLDATQLRLYEDYSTASRHLPGGRYAYDKGTDPYEMVLSTRWAEWKRQTRAYFQGFDLAQIPVAGGRDLSPVSLYVAADAPVWRWIAERARRQKVRTFSFNTDYGKHLAAARGKTLVITAVGDAIALPPSLDKAYLPVPRREIARRLKTVRHGQMTRGLPDGTRVVLLFARDLDAMAEAVQRLKL